MESGGFLMDFDSIMDQFLVILKVGLACSPIILIGVVLAFAREDDETEAAKTNSKVRPVVEGLMVCWEPASP